MNQAVKKFLLRLFVAAPLVAAGLILGIIALLVPELRAWAADLPTREYNSYAVNGTTLAADPIANKFFVIMGGYDGTNWRAVRTDASGNIGFSGFPTASALTDADSNPTTTRIGSNLEAFRGNWLDVGGSWARVTGGLLGNMFFSNQTKFGINSISEPYALAAPNGALVATMSYATDSTAIVPVNNSTLGGTLGVTNFNRGYNVSTNRWDPLNLDTNDFLKVTLATVIDPVNDGIALYGKNSTHGDTAILATSTGYLLTDPRIPDGSVLTGYSQPGTNIELSSSAASSCTASNALTVGAYYEIQTNGRTHCTMGADNTVVASVTTSEPYDSPGIYHRFVIDTSHDTFCCITDGATVLVDITPQTLVAQ